MLAENNLAPDFEAQDDSDQTVSLSAYREKWVVLYFFPKAMTSG